MYPSLDLIHPTAVIGPGVRVGDGVSIGPHAVVLGPTEIGDGVWIGPGATIGGPPEVSSLRQNAAWAGDLAHHGVRIGANAVIREHVTIHQGSHRTTVVGEGVWLLQGSYIAHDVQVGDRAVISSGVSVGGHAEIGEDANLGMNAAVHQRRIVGPGAMVGMGTPVSRDVPPFAKVYGSPPRLEGVNTVALQRRGCPDELLARFVAMVERGDLMFDTDEFDDAVLAPAIAWWRARERRPVESGARIRAALT